MWRQQSIGAGEEAAALQAETGRTGVEGPGLDGPGSIVPASSAAMTAGSKITKPTVQLSFR